MKWLLIIAAIVVCFLIVTRVLPLSSERTDAGVWINTSANVKCTYVNPKPFGSEYCFVFSPFSNSLGGEDFSVRIVTNRIIIGQRLLSPNRDGYVWLWDFDRIYEVAITNIAKSKMKSFDSKALKNIDHLWNAH